MTQIWPKLKKNTRAVFPSLHLPFFISSLENHVDHFVFFYMAAMFWWDHILQNVIQFQHYTNSIEFAKQKSAKQTSCAFSLDSNFSHQVYLFVASRKKVFIFFLSHLTGIFCRQKSVNHIMYVEHNESSSLAD